MTRTPRECVYLPISTSVPFLQGMSWPFPTSQEIRTHGTPADMVGQISPPISLQLWTSGQNFILLLCRVKQGEGSSPENWNIFEPVVHGLLVVHKTAEGGLWNPCYTSPAPNAHSHTQKQRKAKQGINKGKRVFQLLLNIFLVKSKCCGCEHRYFPEGKLVPRLKKQLQNQERNKRFCFP